MTVNQLESSEFDVGISLLNVSIFHKVVKLMTMFMMMIDIASVEIVEKVQVTRRHSTICTMFTKVKTHQNSALIGNILDSFSFYLVIVLSCFHNLHIVKIENQLCLSSDVTVID